MGGNVTFNGAFTTALTVTANTTLTLPTSGTITTTSSNLGVFAATTSSQLASVISDETGSGSLVFNTSPSLITPTLGVATATSINGLTITSSTGTLTVGTGKTLTSSNTLTFNGTDGSAIALGAGGTVVYTGATSLPFLNTIGVVTSGQWNAATIGVPYGGTGLTSLTSGSVLIGAGTAAPTLVAPGTSGNVLTSNGTTWVSSSAAATGITSVTGNNGITANTVSGAVTVGLSTVATGSILANVSGSTAVPIAKTLTSILDSSIGSTQGTIMYRNASTWVALAPSSTPGQVLTTGGTGGNPSWTTVNSGVFSKSYISPQQTMTAAGTLTLAHSLGTQPLIVLTSVICQTAEFGYSVGDELIVNMLNPFQASGGAACGASIVPDSTNLNIRFTSQSLILSEMINKSDGTTCQFTTANWKMVFKAFA